MTDTLLWCDSDDNAPAHKETTESSIVSCDQIHVSHDSAIETVQSRDVPETQHQLSSLSERIDALGNTTIFLFRKL